MLKDFSPVSGLSADGKEHFSGTHEMKSDGFSESFKTLSSYGENGSDTRDHGVYRVVSHESILVSEFPRNPYRGGKSSINFQLCQAFSSII